MSKIPFTFQKELVARSEIKSIGTEINKLERPLNKMKSIAKREEGRRSSIPRIYLQVFVHIPDQKKVKNSDRLISFRLRSNRAPTRTRGFLIASPPPHSGKKGRSTRWISIQPHRTLSAPLQFLRVSSRHIFAALFFLAGRGDRGVRARCQSATAGERAMCIIPNTRPDIALTRLT